MSSSVTKDMMHRFFAGNQALSAASVPPYKRQRIERAPVAPPAKPQLIESAPVALPAKPQHTENVPPLTDEQQHALTRVLAGESIFVTGSAGTGKSFLVRRLVSALEDAGKTVHVTSSTGISACAIGGITLHRFAGAGLAKGDTARCIAYASRRDDVVERWLEADALVVDEVSMLTADFFSKVDAIGRNIRRCPEKPFGGVQLVLCGDFCQLPPIVRRGEERVYCFETSVWRELIDRDHSILLTHSFRQSTTDPLHGVLEKIRLGALDDACLRVLRSRCVDPDTAAENDTDTVRATKLYSLRRQANEENLCQLAKLPGEEHVYEARDDGDPTFVEQLHSHCQAGERLALRRGAQVILLKNLDTSRGLANGSRGVVVAFEEDAPHIPIVRFVSGTTIACTAKEWSIETTEKGVVATRTQIPLLLAWAITIHKSQGMGINLLDVDLSTVFETGQAYVALSRATCLDGLTIATDVRASQIRCDPKVTAFYAMMSREPVK